MSCECTDSGYLLIREQWGMIIESKCGCNDRQETASSLGLAGSVAHRGNLQQPVSDTWPRWSSGPSSELAELLKQSSNALWGHGVT